MHGFEPQTLVSEATALPTELQPMPTSGQSYQRSTFVIYDSIFVHTEFSCQFDFGVVITFVKER